MFPIDKCILLCLAVAGLGGCATSSQLARFDRAHAGAPIKTLVMEVPMAVDPDRLQEVLAPNLKVQSTIGDGDEPVVRGEQHAQAYALTAMESVLNRQSGFAVIVPGTGNGALLDKVRAEGLGQNITQQEADQLHAATGADALLRFEITDYGMTPKAWRKGYITFEVASTVAIAGIIAYTGSTAAHAAAGAYLAQETAEETAEGYAGFWALDVAGRPVRLEAELVQLNPVAIVWKSADTGMSDLHWSRLTRKIAAPERNRQLDQATDDAVKEVVADLSSANRMY
jgi:hypothetical protein